MTAPVKVFALLMLLACATPAAAQDGDTIFTEKHCNVCHAVGIDPPDKVGPHLNGVVGRAIGSLPGYSYSDELIQAGDAGLSWTPELLGRYLKSPRHLFPGTTMSYAGIARRADIDAMVKYLAAFAPDGNLSTP